MNARLRAVIRKEFREYRRNRFIVLTMAVMPAILLVVLVAEGLAIPATAAPNVLRAAIGEALVFFLVVPVILPTTVAAYAVIGEREQGTLEPVLTTPVTDRELLAGKAIAAVVPAVLLSWLLFVAYVAVEAISGRGMVLAQVLTLDQVVAQLLGAPALAGFGIVAGILASLRSTDIRVAQQLAGLATLPVFGLVALFSFRVVEPSVGIYVAGAALIAAIDLAGWRLAVSLFSRERLIAKYGS